MAFDSRRRLTECLFLREGRCNVVIAVGSGPFAFFSKAADRRLDIGGVELVQLLNILHDIVHLRTVHLSFGLAYFQMRQLCYLSDIHSSVLDVDVDVRIDLAAFDHQVVPREAVSRRFKEELPKFFVPDRVQRRGRYLRSTSFRLPVKYLLRD